MELLTTKGTIAKIESLISDSKETLTLVSPFLYIETNFIKRIDAAIQRKVRVTIVYNPELIKIKEVAKLSKLKGVKFFAANNLHGKIYFNESDAVVTSMNLTELSERRNIEFGIGFSVTTALTMYDKLISEFELIEKYAVKFKDDGSEPERLGFCIRCGDNSIDINKEQPLCPECLKIWRKYRNRTYVEKFCHKCGTSNETTFGEPFCELHLKLLTLSN